MARIRKNDKVKVLAGKEKGRQGKVLKVFSEKETALVERLNMVKRHTKAGGRAGQQGGIIEKEAPIRVAKLMLVCPKCSKATRTGVRLLDDGSRVRYCKKCSEQLES
ncbi:MAG TPA: 50S ribosomal protein L24 [Desulfomonilaceae bacterium]|nr:50S ribosomal protein L24 [Desulfomonilaceae bacterium]